MMQSGSTISLLDNTIPGQRSDDEAPQPSTATRTPSLNLTKRLTGGSIRQRRKYAKWQQDKLGLNEDASVGRVNSRASSASRRERPPSDWDGDTDGSLSREDEERRNIDATDFARVASEGQTEGPPRTENADLGGSSQLDVLYENQRGMFFFGIPLYSHESLLNLDPAPWVTQDFKESPVDITNAQVPDPSWKWAWKTWYVDMSGDVDEEGWEYSFSFSVKKAWHGTHPWFHSWVRRRRWVRLRTKRFSKRTERGRSGFEMAHMFNEDYFTIHPTLTNVTSREPSIGPSIGRGSIARAAEVHKIEEEEYHFDEIGDIPTLMQAVKHAIVDREKLTALNRFIQEGGEELHYLPSKIPEIMSRLVYQTSRWQFYSYLQGVIEEESKDLDENDTSAEAAAKKRRIANLSKAAESVKSHTPGPVVLFDPQGTAVGKVDLPPAWANRRLSSSSVKREQSSTMNGFVEIKGIPEEAEVGQDDHRVHIRRS
ncbi:hypothetical protein DTO271G3_4013 [Paecilomyces variotii]|nr:hypothetical protein DTO271G3_4013 [Paecilomyces variotii]